MDVGLDELDYLHVNGRTNRCSSALVQYGPKGHTVVLAVETGILAFNVVKNDNGSLALVSKQLLNVDFYNKSTRIVCMGCYVDLSAPVPIIAVGVVEKIEKQKSYQLHFYDKLLAGSSSDGQELSPGVMFRQVLSVDYVPIAISSTRLKKTGESLLLVTGSDNGVYAYHRSEIGNFQIFEGIQQQIPELLPKNLPDECVLALDVDSNARLIDTTARRFCVLACENGLLQVYVRQREAGETFRIYNKLLDGPLSTVLAFRDRSKAVEPRNHLLKAIHSRAVETNSPRKENVGLNVLVGSAIGFAAVFRSVMHGLSDVHYLPDSTSYGTITTSTIGDYDWDGDSEIFLGTASGVVLVYKYCPSKSTDEEKDISSHTNIAARSEYTLLFKRNFGAPICGLYFEDFSDSGLPGLLVVTAVGVHFLQRDMRKVKERIQDRLGLVNQILDLESRLSIS
mmetsp:Transcript_29090/g.32307  ORF Transcript_29090/g.32307 Transcript_29090/m.32307 type:complete len:452 (-) Transcript_29090:26-1381(-)